MKKLIPIILVITLFSFSAKNGVSQCKSFAKKVCMLELVPFVHDGIYNAAMLSEGEYVELYKAFYSGQDYRIAICGADDIPKVNFQVLDKDKNVLYDNKKYDYDRVWDFTLDSSQLLTIVIQVETSDQLSDEISNGCVAVLVGFMNKEDSFEQF
jgi:hypothetical protein